MGNFFIITICTLIASAVCYSQPNSQLYLIEYTRVADKFNVDYVRYLSAFNEKGYNNQPKFFSPDELYISSDYYSKGVPEIIKLDLSDETLERMTHSVEHDYSPAPLPGYDGFSTVRIEQDGKTQSLWAYDNQSFDPGVRLLDDVSTIGYYQWLDDNNVAMFLLPEPFTLAIGNAAENSIQPKLENIGRCFNLNDDGDLLFTQKVGDTHYIKSYNHQSGSINTICPVYADSQDFAYLRGGTLLMGKGHKLYAYQIDTNEGWVEVMDLKEYGISTISRLSVSRGKIALVNHPKLSR